jgi:glycerol-3-phosphate dehydrogenase
VLYYDGQFDDSRLLINLLQTAHEHGTACVNYAQVSDLTKDDEGFIDGLTFTDLETQQRHDIRARCVINATGAFCDSVRKMDDSEARPMIAPSQGVHVVLDGSFLPGNTAIMVPRTSDGRVMFAIPWHGHALLGTTDTPITKIELEPRPMEHEIDFLLETASQYLAKNPTRADIRSTFAGIRPLVKSGDPSNTAALSREHTIHVSKSGLLTIAGGKWTTYRRMAEDCVDHAATLGKLEERDCLTRDLKIHGWQEATQASQLQYYGADEHEIRNLIQGDSSLGTSLSDELPILGAQVVWAARQEMARTVDDVLSRRTRALFLHARAAVEMAPAVAKLLAAELGREQQWQEDQVHQFTSIAQGYLVTGAIPA